MKTHVVTKKLPGPDGTILEPGTEVDASEWRNSPLLVSQRYLKPLDGVEAPIEGTVEAVSKDQIISTVVQDIRENGAIAQALRETMLTAPPKPTSRSKRAAK